VTWYPFDDRHTIGEKGSEDGVIVIDEECDATARITLERDARRPFAITCGVYGWMVHTRFFMSEEEARQAFAAMKVELARIAGLIPFEDDPDRKSKMRLVCEELGRFVDAFP
jgi:hypothetical protein